MTDNAKITKESKSELVYKVVLEIAVVGNSRQVSFNIKNYPEDFEEYLQSAGSDDLPLSYEIMQQIMGFITMEVAKGQDLLDNASNYRVN